MGKKNITVIGLFLLAALMIGVYFLSQKDQKISSEPIDLNQSSVCITDSDCKRIEGYDTDGCLTCNSYAGNIFDERNNIFGRPSDNSGCPMIDCFDAQITHPACVNNKCVLAKNSKISDCGNNVTCLLIYAKENNDRSICEKIKTISPESFKACLFQFTKNIEDCNKLSDELGISPDSEQSTYCFVLHAKTNSDCNMIQHAYEKNKCLADTATKIRECEFIDTSITEKDPNNYRSWCYTRTKDAIPESMNDCNLLMSINDFPVNCINNFVKKDLSKDILMNSCHMLKNKKSIDYCLSQI